VTTIALRHIEDGDLNALYEQQRDPAAVRMAACTPENPDDRVAFDAHMARVRTDADVTMRAVARAATLVGSVASFAMDGQTEVTYWIERSAWGCGVAGRALALLLELVSVRPSYARPASDNVASLRVLSRAGFVAIGTERSFANGRGRVITERILRKDQ
jgi:RimJ/RimL family protein N-acetyltransferase